MTVEAAAVTQPSLHLHIVTGADFNYRVVGRDVRTCGVDAMGTSSAKLQVQALHKAIEEVSEVQ